MSQGLPWSVKGIDASARDAARMAARRAGMSVGEWLETVIRDHAAGGDEGDPAESEPRDLGKRLSSLSQDRLDTASHRFAPSLLTRSEAEALLQHAAESEKRAREASERTADVLDSIARWMEKTESRLTATERTTAERQERTATVMAEAIKTVGSRLADVERRSGQERRAHPELRAQPDRRAANRRPAAPGIGGGFGGGFGKANFADAIADIRARQRDLDMGGAPYGSRRASDEEGREDAGESVALREELAALRRELKSTDARDSGDLLQSLNTLISRLDKGSEPTANAHVLRALARLEADVSRLVGAKAPAGSDIERQISRLHARLDQIGPQSDGRGLSTLGREIADLRTRMSVDVGERLALIADDVAQLKRSQSAPGGADDIREAIEDIRVQLGRDRSDDFAELRLQLDALSQRIETLPSLATADLDQRIARLVDRLDQPQAQDTANLDRRLDELQAMLEHSIAKPQPGLERQIESLAARLENLAASNGLREVIAGDGKTATADLRPMEAMLRDLQERVSAFARPERDLSSIESMLESLHARIEQAQSPDAGNEALAALERQIAQLAERMDHMGPPSDSGLERTLRDLINTVGAFREDASTQAERAARAVLEGTLGAKHVADGDEKITQALETVQDAMDKILARLSAIENDLTGQAPRARAAGADVAMPQRSRLDAVLAPTGAGRVEEPRRLEEPRFAEESRPEPRLEPRVEARARPVRPGVSEQPLEPGSGRPRAGAPVREDAADPQAVKANYIAAARRAVQAAAEEAKAASNEKNPPAGDCAPSPSRIKAALQRRKKPILLGLAAAVFLAGSAHVISNSLFGNGAGAPKTGAKTSAKSDQKDEAREEVSRAAPREAVSAPVAQAEKAEPSVPATGSTPRVSATLMTAPASEQAVVAAAPMPATNFTSAAAAPKAEEAAPALVPGAVTSLPEIPASIGMPGLRKAVLAGDARAAYDLATRLVDGRGLKRDAQLAIKLFERTAAAGLPAAQFRLGNMYEKGIGTAADVGLARLWYERAAQNGNAKAMHNLAVLYAEGATGKPDYPMAVEWFRKASEYGVRDSQYNLAVLLARGLGAPQDMTQAYVWFAAAAAQGDEDAGKKRDEVGAKLSAADLATAREALQRWKPRTLDPAGNEVQLPAKGWETQTESQAPAQKPAKQSRG